MPNTSPTCLTCPAPRAPGGVRCAACRATWRAARERNRRTCRAYYQRHRVAICAQKRARRSERRLALGQPGRVPGAAA